MEKYGFASQSERTEKRVLRDLSNKLHQYRLLFGMLYLLGIAEQSFFTFEMMSQPFIVSLYIRFRNVQLDLFKCVIITIRPFYFCTSRKSFFSIVHAVLKTNRNVKYKLMLQYRILFWLRWLFIYAISTSPFYYTVNFVYIFFVSAHLTHINIILVWYVFTIWIIYIFVRIISSSTYCLSVSNSIQNKYQMSLLSIW